MAAAAQAAGAHPGATPEAAGAKSEELPNQEQGTTIPRWEQADLAMIMPETATPEPPEPTGDDEQTPVTAPVAAATQPWPTTLPEQVRVLAQLLVTAPTALPLPAIEARFKGRGPWKKSLPRILETLEALGRARREGDGWRG
jgi:hypothetical protein